MTPAAMLLVAAVAMIHLVFAFAEMYAWDRLGPRILRAPTDKLVEQTKLLAANQGVYNALLACGLIWSLLISAPGWDVNVATCFLLIIIAAGVYGGLTVKRSILYAQAGPAVIALGAIYLI